jgi:glyoxylase-like metal-dependent hydrolase (beta-lactamase superfamily II)
MNDDAALHHPLLRPPAGHVPAPVMNTSVAAAHDSPLRFRWLEPPPPGTALDVVPGLKWLRMPLPFALDHINLWLLADGESWTAVDCGYGDAATRALWERHFRETLAGKPIGHVIATHYHPDHLGNAAWLAARWDCKVAVPQAEYLTAHAVADERAGYGAAATSALFRMHGLTDEHIAALEARGNQYRRGVPELPGAYQRLLAGDDVAIGAERWRVIPGYGHSPEHAALYCATSNVLISGDMLLPKISTNVSVWPVEPDGDPLGRFLASLDAFTRLPSKTLVLPSHGLPFVGIRTRVEQLRAHHVARLAELEAAASSPVTAAQMLPVLFRRTLDVQQRFFAMGEAIAHLNHLWHKGRLARSSADGVLRFGRPG